MNRFIDQWHHRRAIIRAEEKGIYPELCKLTWIVDHDIREPFTQRHSSIIQATIITASRSDGATPGAVPYRMLMSGRTQMSGPGQHLCWYDLAKDSMRISDEFSICNRVIVINLVLTVALLALLWFLWIWTYSRLFRKRKLSTYNLKRTKYSRYFFLSHHVWNNGPSSGQHRKCSRHRVIRSRNLASASGSRCRWHCHFWQKRTFVLTQGRRTNNRSLRH